MRRQAAGKCVNCGKGSAPVSMYLGLCAECIRGDFQKVLPRVRKAHERARRDFGLPALPPRAAGGVTCAVCANECRMADGDIGYCGLRRNQNGKLVGGEPERGLLDWYYDPLPTNCVADWVCPGGSGAGYPQFAHTAGPERGHNNLSVFYNGCSFDCLFCQNWHHREGVGRLAATSPSELAARVDRRTSCICFFGGDPTPQLRHALAAARLARQQHPGEILRICWETNGSMNPQLLDDMIDLSLESGGCLKFDLKAWSEALNIALCGVGNTRTLANFRRAAERAPQRPDPPLLIASTLLVPGYVDDFEVEKLAAFVAALDPAIPYALLGFQPQFYMADLPVTSRSHAHRALDIARDAGLTNVRIGNVHLLSDSY